MPIPFSLHDQPRVGPIRQQVAGQQILSKCVGEWGRPIEDTPRESDRTTNVHRDVCREQQLVARCLDERTTSVGQPPQDASKACPGPIFASVGPQRTCNLYPWAGSILEREEREHTLLRP